MSKAENFIDLLSKNKEELLSTKIKIINEIKEYIEHNFKEGDLNRIFEIRQFIDGKQSYFALSCTLAPPILTLNGVDIKYLAPDIILTAFQDAVKISEELREESEKIYSNLSKSFRNKSS